MAEDIEVTPTITGTIIGPVDQPRLICMASTLCFDDLTVVSKNFGMEPENFNSGAQGHFYTRAGDAMVYRVPPKHLNEDGVNSAIKAVVANARVWKRFTGRDLLVPGNGNLHLSTETTDVELPRVPAEYTDTVSLHRGIMTEVALEVYRAAQGRLSLLASLISPEVAQETTSGYNGLHKIARTVSRLNSKNSALPILAQAGVPIPATFPVNNGESFDLSVLDEGCRYVFKPTGGAGGVGMMGLNGGLTVDEIASLYTENRLQPPFQLQEFISGDCYGALALFEDVGRVKLVGLHRQILNGGVFIGGFWNQEIQSRFEDQAARIFYLIAGLATEHPFIGPIGLDFLDEQNQGKMKVLETNPRTTGNQPLVVIRSATQEIGQALKRPDWTPKSIRLSIKVNVPPSLMADNAFLELAESIYQNEDLIVLPQGLDPFMPASTKVAFVDPNGRDEAELAVIQTRYFPN